MLQREVHALRGIDLAIGRGQMVSVMGPSGCGKTTLLNCLSGLDAIDGGDVLIDGVALSSLSDKARTDYRARRMGFVFQYYNLMPVLTAVENVELPLLVSRVAAPEARRRAYEALELVGIPQRARHLPEQLSGGERQRVTIARALVNDPAIVWADEPTGNLDSQTAAAVLEVLHEAHAAGQTLVLVTHDRGIGASGTRLVQVRDGLVVYDGDPSVLRNGNPEPALAVAP